MSHTNQVVLKQQNGDWLHFTSMVRSLSACRRDEVMPLIRHVGEISEQNGVYAAGFVSYESAAAFDPALPSKEDNEFPLCWFGLFQEVRTTKKLSTRPNVSCPLQWQPTRTPEEYRRCLRVIRNYIRRGDTYQVNFTFPLRAFGHCDPWNFFLRAMAYHSPPFAAFIDTGEWVVCSMSPELFFRLDGDRIESRPMKGTAARGLWCEDDQHRAAQLLSSAKNRAENIMIVDMVRNDVGRIAEFGSVHVPQVCVVERYPTVWQMTSTVRAITHSPLDQIFAAIFPPASITGAPKRRTMEIIAELEQFPRRIYTGAIGYIAPKRKAQFNVAIRTVLMHRPSGRWEYGVGGGIVWDSNASAEFEECLIKAKVLSMQSQDFDLRETMRWSPEEGYFLLEYHLKRLYQSAQYFDFAVDMTHIRHSLEDLSATLPQAPHRISMTIAREGAPRFQVRQIGADYMRFADIPLAKKPVDCDDMFLYHKTTCRRPYEQALSESSGNTDVLLLNKAGQVTESTLANVAFEIDGQLCTPPVKCGLLPGTYRAWLLDQCRVQERIVTVDQAVRCASVYLMNSVRGMHQVKIIQS